MTTGSGCDSSFHSTKEGFKESPVLRQNPRISGFHSTKEGFKGRNVEKQPFT